MLENDTLKNGTSRVGLYGGVPPGFHGSSFKGFLLFFLLPDWLKLNHLKSGMGGFRRFFVSYLFHRSRNNRRDKLRSKFWCEKMFRQPHLKLLK